MNRTPKVWHQGETTFTSYYAPERQETHITAQRLTPSGRMMAAVTDIVPDEVLAASKIIVKSHIDMVTNNLMLALDNFIEGETDANTSD